MGCEGAWGGGEGGARVCMCVCITSVCTSYTPTYTINTHMVRHPVGYTSTCISWLFTTGTYSTY